MSLNQHSVLKSVKNELKSLEQYAELFLDIFAKEEQAIIHHDINSLEKIGQQKNQLLLSLQNGITNVAKLCTQLFHPPLDPPKSFSEMQGYLKSYTSGLTSDSYQLKALSEHLITRLSVLIETYRDIKPQIEKNRFIIARLLRNHQESYRFWSELKKENSSSYNAKGAKKSPSTISQVFAKA
ncbi:MAG: flagellar protein FlgN [Oligoflexales bacterium]|nr:flagellar protein FlgN [Oligoflexales bacterium]